MRLLLIASFILCGTLHAIVLLREPTCSGLVISKFAILTLGECISSSSELIAPIKLKPTHFLMHADSHVGFLIFSQPLPYEPIILGGSKTNLQEAHIGQKVIIGNSLQSINSSITQISQTHLWSASGVSPVLLGTPLWSVTNPSRSYKAMGLMVAETRALKLDLYIDFISQLQATPQINTQKVISLPAIPINERSPIVSLDARIVKSDVPEDTPSPTAGAQTPEANSAAPNSTPQSIGCACSQTGIEAGRTGFLRRLFGR